MVATGPAKSLRIWYKTYMFNRSIVARIVAILGEFRLLGDRMSLQARGPSFGTGRKSVSLSAPSA